MSRTTPAPAGRPVTATPPLTDHTVAMGLRVLAAAAWPESAADRVPPALPGFVLSTFSPLFAETATRCLTRRPPGALPVPGAAVGGEHAVRAEGEGDGGVAGSVAASAPAPGARPAEGVRTAVVIVSALGDVAGAVRVAEAVDGGQRPGPLMFFQAVPNAVAGLVAARWGLCGPVVCVADGRAGVEVAALLIEDGDAEEALVVLVDQASGDGDRDRAEAVLLNGGDRP
ncbi:hypothetical protein [Streptomyces sp. NBC_01198]|uniref:hypothetical protein n=1 Tax=Streptomyces sp. NBC_01198 TaxID=2903769 RepID=UPI002E0EA5B4|nr:hypothetical protein OG702_05815 [Streptomyces sp. NBC_01198]